MEINIIATVIGTGAAVVGVIYTFFRNLRTDIHDKIGGVNNRIDLLETDIKNDIRAQTARIDQTNMRMDQFQYQIELRMEQAQQQSNLRIDQMHERMDQFQKMFYDLLNAQHPKTNP